MNWQLFSRKFMLSSCKCQSWNSQISLVGATGVQIYTKDRGYCTVFDASFDQQKSLWEITENGLGKCSSRMGQILRHSKYQTFLSIYRNQSPQKYEQKKNIKMNHPCHLILCLTTPVSSNALESWEKNGTEALRDRSKVRFPDWSRNQLRR